MAASPTDEVSRGDKATAVSGLRLVSLSMGNEDMIFSRRLVDFLFVSSERKERRINEPLQAWP